MQIHPASSRSLKPTVRNSQAYLSAKEVEDKLIEEGMSVQTILNASHLLVSMEALPNPQDTLNTYNFVSIRDTLQRGISFEEMAIKHSTDPPLLIKVASGISLYLTWCTLESAAYNTAVGEIS